jgi:hypothetical protein
MTILTLARPSGRRDERSFLLQRAQPAMTGLIDGSLSTRRGRRTRSRSRR